MGSAALQIDLVRPVGPLLLVADYARKLGIQAVIDRLCPSRSNARLTHAQVALAIIANRLCHPTAMVHLVDWARDSALGQVFELASSLLNDDRIARCLDALCPHLNEIQGAAGAPWALTAVDQFGLQLRRLHWDLTSVVLQGEYPPEEPRGHHAMPAYGYGGEDDCKQLRVGELLTGGALWACAVPLYQLRQDGNTADVGTILPVLEAVGSHLPLKDCLVIGDSKLLSMAIISKLRAQQFWFLAPVQRDDAIHEAFEGLDPDAWVQLDYLPRRQERTPEQERTVYRGQETAWLYRDAATGEQVSLRRLFVLNERERDARKRRRLGSIQRYVEKLNELQRKVGKRGMTTRGQLERSLGKLQKDHATASAFVKVRIRTEEPIHLLYWDLEEEALRDAERLDGVTVLLTNLPREEADEHELLRIWKGQGESERRFSDWKGPLKVRPVFLTTPRRINALLVLLHFALMIYCLIEREARRAAERQGMREVLGLYAGRDAIPTGRLILQAFEFVHMVEYRVQGRAHRQIEPLTPLQERLRRMLGITWPPW